MPCMYVQTARMYAAAGLPVLCQFCGADHVCPNVLDHTGLHAWLECHRLRQGVGVPAQICSLSMQMACLPMPYVKWLAMIQ